ncbi:hypothetical protein KF728_19100 [Candidatus Obscuribacterales bacterium]|nr:hypothetical protein [Candidatus Obscuribacterales bacterium]
MRERSRMARVSVEEYLELDRQSFERLEFLDGRVAAMTGTELLPPATGRNSSKTQKSQASRLAFHLCI